MLAYVFSLLDEISVAFFNTEKVKLFINHAGRPACPDWAAQTIAAA